ncbi:hypothetical protein WDW37_20390 [Bdellovibrionota bacterium FG-1]
MSNPIAFSLLLASVMLNSSLALATPAKPCRELTQPQVNRIQTALKLEQQTATCENYDSTSWDKNTASPTCSDHRVSGSLQRDQIFVSVVEGRPDFFILALYATDSPDLNYVWVNSPKFPNLFTSLAAIAGCTGAYNQGMNPYLVKNHDGKIVPKPL